MEADLRNRQFEALGIAESIAIRLRQIIAGQVADRRNACEYADLSRTLGDVEDRLYRQGEYAPENVAGQPGYPGPCPEGVSWERWLAQNNVD
jgi:hypothetical protein